MPKEPEQSISAMSGDQLIQYLHILSQRQSEFSKLRIDLLERLKPIERQRADLRADIQKVTESQKQCKVEIAATKYAIRAEANT